MNSFNLNKFIISKKQVFCFLVQKNDEKRRQCGIIDTERKWRNGRRACFRRMCPFGREGSNPFLRILERWPSSVRHRTRNPASGFYSRAGSNPVLSFYNKQDMSYEAHVFSVILFLLLEGYLLGGRSLLS